MNKKWIIIFVALFALMYFTNPSQEKHAEKYSASTSIGNKIGDIVTLSGGEYSNLYLLSYYIRGNSSSIGAFGMVLSL